MAPTVQIMARRWGDPDGPRKMAVQPLYTSIDGRLTYRRPSIS
jgi:hypothetical protein